jgi:hypothetical protein
MAGDVDATASWFGLASQGPAVAHGDSKMHVRMAHVLIEQKAAGQSASLVHVFGV